MSDCIKKFILGNCEVMFLRNKCLEDLKRVVNHIENRNAESYQNKDYTFVDLGPNLLLCHDLAEKLVINRQRMNLLRL
jgi:hypothetical protein